MSKHARDAEATELWEYYRDVIDWVRMTFPKYRKEMKDVNRDWGRLFHDFKDEHYDTALLEEEIDRLMKDDDITSSKGIYLYVLTRQERFLSLRTFDQRTRRAAYESQNGRCPLCGMTYKYDEMEADHIIPWSKGGHTTADNCQMLCRECNRTKGNK
jgi:predicted restriction endonuclease